MTESKAIELLEYIRKTGNGEAPYVGCAQNIAIEMAIQALEKQIPKKPINTCQYVSGCCPNCKKYISDWLEYNEFMCCPYCGQKLGWSEECLTDKEKENGFR